MGGLNHNLRRSGGLNQHFGAGSLVNNLHDFEEWPGMNPIASHPTLPPAHTSSSPLSAYHNFANNAHQSSNAKIHQLNGVNSN